MPALPRPVLIAAAVALALALPLAACTSAPPATGFPQIAFDDRPPLRLDVGAVTIEQAYQPPNAAPNVDHRFPVRPLDAAVRWAEERLVAAGDTRRARYIVRDASVVETPLKPIDGLKGLFTTEQSERYDARLVVELELVGDDGRVLGMARAEAVRTRSVPEDITLSEREKVWFEMTEDLMRELDAELEETIRKVFAKYVVS